MNKAMRTARDILVLLVIVVGLTALLIVGLNFLAVDTGAANMPQTFSLASFKQNDVAVELAYEQGTDGKNWVVGTFTPTREGFHLYSLDLPRDGISGLGRPTLIEQVTPQGVKPLGALTANQPTIGQYTHAIRQTLPVYPDGPVTLRVQVTDKLPSELAITYMACNQYVCLEPVTEKRVAVAMP